MQKVMREDAKFKQASKSGVDLHLYRPRGDELKVESKLEVSHSEIQESHVEEDSVSDVSDGDLEFDR